MKKPKRRGEDIPPKIDGCQVTSRKHLLLELSFRPCVLHMAVLHRSSRPGPKLQPKKNTQQLSLAVFILIKIKTCTRTSNKKALKKFCRKKLTLFSSFFLFFYLCVPLFMNSLRRCSSSGRCDSISAESQQKKKTTFVPFARWCVRRVPFLLPSSLIPFFSKFNFRKSKKMVLKTFLCIWARVSIWFSFD